ncbi:MAG: hypothetical protein JWP89_59 [Schlesneria sp.]|nr:hypothetical protein [Schlesneria sp.]
MADEYDTGQLREHTIRQHGMIIERNARGKIISARFPPTRSRLINCSNSVSYAINRLLEQKKKAAGG